MSTTTPHTRRRWFQFSLLSLMIFTTLSALAIAWNAVPAWRQHEAVLKLIELDGQVEYDFQLSGAKSPPGPAWLRKWLGDDFFQRVGRVRLERNVDTAEALHAALAQVSRLPAIDFLIIHSREGLDDANLREIANSRSLKALHLHGPCPDSALSHLQPLAHLRALLLQDVTDATLAQVAQLRGLEFLYLYGEISDDGLAELEPLVELQDLAYNSGKLTMDLTNPTNVDYQDASVPDTIDYLHDMTDVTFVFDDRFVFRQSDYLADSSKKAIVDNLLSTDLATAIPLRQVLDRLLAPHGLDFRIDKETVVITTREEADRARAGIRALQKKLPKLKNTWGW